LALAVLQKDTPCDTFYCSFAGVFQPRLHTRAFVAIGHYTFLVRTMGMRPDSSCDEIQAKVGHRTLSFFTLSTFIIGRHFMFF
jgi:hypothetical protein